MHAGFGWRRPTVKFHSEGEWLRVILQSGGHFLLRVASNLQLDHTLPTAKGQFDSLTKVLQLAEHERVLWQVDLPLKPHVQRPEQDNIVHSHSTLAKGDTA